ncbi:hypothetical protein J2T13_003956 [Paenibacillus sp. DS2015]|uniref:GIY-YIG nuclease family protein n=1 Tax=Paenibacillus sp. DS2015 TaxID=3373917 RepID=UPI003D1EFEA0
MDHQRRKELVTEYQQRPRHLGIYQIHNVINGKKWINSSSNLYGALNKEKFLLNMGMHSVLELQKEWKEYGEDAFKLEILDEIKLEEGESLMGMVPINVPVNHPSYKKHRDKLQVMQQMWMDKLQPYGDKGYHELPEGEH